MKVLIVHRQKEVMAQIKSVLHSNHSIIRFSDSGLDGLLAARIEIFDLIICSTDLPVITGFELVRSIKNTSMNKMTPIIFLTEVINEKSLLLGKLLGVNAMFEHQEVNEPQLANLISKTVSVAPDTKWEDLLTYNIRMN